MIDVRSTSARGWYKHNHHHEDRSRVVNPSADRSFHTRAAVSSTVWWWYATVIELF
ncbi:hypothetical protein L227DRAFT_576246 [Lentinus tigrinus ALCF2SS1-6]|uniref:Uncharacterized protein n=1 Tax=Lentinus tigrinus ALCF2SS1-6 TaxID=1328759 RepID=A0A5C2S6S1_9APHY|nr:hypothetical protein L227DRAFT_576246 [Lentinus tigrinus ALCF2SS1-6]